MFDAFRTRDEDAGKNLVHPGFRFSPSTVDAPDGAFVGIDGLFAYLEAIEQTWDDFRFSLGEIHENGEVVCALGRIYARGATDDKGQLFLHVKALEAHLATRGKLPVNVIVVAEGEEEIGSPNLVPFVESHVDRLRCDAAVISDSNMFAPGVPALLSSLRGMAYFQIDVQGPATDLHSGSYGGAVVNPAMALARILATFHDADGRIAIPGFYDQVRDELSVAVEGAYSTFITMLSSLVSTRLCVSQRLVQ